MSNQMTTLESNIPANLSNVFGVDKVRGDLSSGVAMGYATLSFRGQKFRIRSGGDEHLVTKIMDGEETPVPTYPVVIVKASDHISKTYYQGGFSEDGGAPTCWSIDGKKPDPSVETPVHSNCATCPNNVWGSATNPMTGKQIKACADSRRVAVVPMDDIDNSQYGGLMLLRVPGGSLKDLMQYGSGLAGKGIDYRTVGTRLGFDPTTPYPRLTFKPVRTLKEDELAQVAAHINSGQIEAMLEPSTKIVQTIKTVEQSNPAVSLEFEEEEIAVAPKATPKVEAKPKATKKPETIEVEAEVVESVEDTTLADLLSDLEG